MADLKFLEEANCNSNSMISDETTPLAAIAKVGKKPQNKSRQPRGFSSLIKQKKS